jgi:hypothetical protein
VLWLVITHHGRWSTMYILNFQHFYDPLPRPPRDLANTFEKVTLRHWRNNSGAFALTLPLGFQFVNANCWCSHTNSINRRSEQIRTSKINSDQNQSNDSGVKGRHSKQIRLCAMHIKLTHVRLIASLRLSVCPIQLENRRTQELVRRKWTLTTLNRAPNDVW